MKVLLVAYSYPPIQEAQSFRWYYLSEELAKAGICIDVITIKYAKMNEACINLHKNITCKRIFPGPFEYLSLGIRSSLNLDITPDAKIRKTLWFKLMQQSYVFGRKFTNYFIPGDIRTEWFPFVARYAYKRACTGNYDFLITSQEPPVDSFVGLFVKRKLPCMKWIADIADPLTAVYYPRWRRIIDEFLEYKILTKADAVITTCESIIRHFESKYKINRKKFHVINQGFDQTLPRKKRKNNIFTIVYSGTFYKEFRDPINLFNALKELPIPYKFVILGRNESFLPFMKQLGNKCSFLGFVPHFQTLEYQRNADVLIHLGNKQAEQIPGKFFEYLGSGVPILSIVYNDNDETAHLTRKLGVGLVCRNEKDEIKDALMYLYQAWKEGKVNEFFNPHIKQINNFSWQNSARKLLNLLNLLNTTKTSSK